MFGLAKRERKLYDRIIEEKDKTIIALASEVEWHRAQSGTYTGQVFQPVVEPDEAQQALEQLIAGASVGDPSALHMSEDEEEILWNMRHGGLTADAAAQALAQVQGVTELDFNFDDD